MLQNLFKVQFFLSFLLFWVVSINAFAQRNRVELSAEVFNSKHWVVSEGAGGVIVFFEKEGEYIFQKYTPQLQLLWQKHFPIQHLKTYKCHFYFRQFLYIMFAKIDSPEWEIRCFNTSNGNFEQFELQGLPYFEINQLVALEKDVYIQGFLRSVPMVLYLSLNDLRVYTLPNDFEGNGTITTFEMDLAQNCLQVGMSSIYKSQHFKVYLRSFYQHQKISEMILSAPDKKCILNAQRLNNKLIIGNYSHLQSPRFAQGIYMALLSNDEQKVEKYKFYDFVDFKHYFAFLSPEQQKQTREHIQQRRAKSKEYSLTYDTNFSEIVLSDEYFLVLNDVFYALMGHQQFNTRFNIPFFEQWQFNHSIIACFDYEGNLLWDNWMKTEDVKSFEPYHLLQPYPTTDSILLAYTNEKAIYTQWIQKDTVLQPKKDIKLQTLVQDKILESNEIRLTHWFEDYFLLFGYQRLRDKEGKRQVFFLQKVRF